MYFNNPVPNYSSWRIKVYFLKGQDPWELGVTVQKVVSTGHASFALPLLPLPRGLSPALLPRAPGRTGPVPHNTVLPAASKAPSLGLLAPTLHSRLLSVDLALYICFTDLGRA